MRSIININDLQMEQSIYQLSLIVTGILNIIMGLYLLFAGVGMFSYMVYSIENYGKVIDPATRATLDVSMQRKNVRKYKK